MKLKQWLYGATALAMLAACSDKDIAPGGGSNGENGYTPTEKVNGYLAVEIKLPEDSGTRGLSDESNDYFKDGTANEYKVHNALIAIFKGSTEKEAEFVRAQALKKPFFTSTPSDDNITSSYLAAIEVQTQVEEDDQFWAWVILNSDLVPDKGDDTYETITYVSSFEIGGIKVMPADDDNKTSGTKFKEIIENAKITDSATTDSFVTWDGKNGKDAAKFFMTNAPLSNKIGSESGITLKDLSYLTPLGGLHDTMEEAKTADDRACVYVERAVAKLTCTQLTDDKLELEFLDEDGNTINLKNDGWSIKVSTFKYALTNTPYESYVIRNVELGETADTHFDWSFSWSNGNRFISKVAMPALGDPFHSADKSVYRTYWCKDPHYTTEMEKTQKKTATLNDLVNWDVPLYCKENTFNVANQKYKNSNIAIFELDLSIEGPEDENGIRKAYPDLYVRDGNASKIYITPEAAYADGITRLLNDIPLQNILKECLKTGVTLPTDENGNTKLDNLKKYFKFSWTTGDVLEMTKFELDPRVEGFYNYFDESSVTKFNTKIGSVNDTDSEQSRILQAVNGLSDVLTYTGGKSYYAIPVKHFGKYYTPWGKDEGQADITGTTTMEVYNTPNNKEWDDVHAKKYLGRYGMVRNNWYELSVSKISSLGTQHIPDVDIELSDDNNQKKQYFAVEIHILSWAKRTQSVQF